MPDPKISGQYSTTEHDEYTEYTVAPNGKLYVEMRDGSTFENALIDCTNNGAGVQFWTWPDRNDPASTPDTMTIRNVGVKGTVPKSNGFMFSVGVRDHGTIEHVYVGDGDAGGPPHDGHGCFFGFEGHLGEMDLRRIYVAGFSDNAFYMPGRPGGRPPAGTGTYHWKDCYVEDCQISAYRVNDQPGTHTLENCHCDMRGNQSRAIWNWESTMDVTDCQLIGGSNGGVVGDGHCNFHGDVQIEGQVTTGTSGSYGSNPTPRPPKTCPQSPEAAAIGLQEDEPDPPDESPGDERHSVTVEPGETVERSFTIDSAELELGEHEWTVELSGDHDETMSGTVYVWGDGFDHVAEGEPVGWITVDFSGEGDIDKFPLFRPEDVDHPAWRVQTPYGPAAFEIKSRYAIREDLWASNPELSVQTEAGIFGVDKNGFQFGEDDQPTDPGQTVVDSFDYGLEPYEGDVDRYSVTTAWAAAGDGALRSEYEDHAGGRIISTDGLPSYPERGDQIEFFWRSTVGSGGVPKRSDERVFHRFLFGVQDAENFYAVTHAVGGQRTVIHEVVDGCWDTIGVMDTEFIPGGTRLRTQIAWNEDGSLGVGLWDDEAERPLQPWDVGEPRNLDVSEGGIGFNHTIDVENVVLLSDHVVRTPIE